MALMSYLTVENIAVLSRLGRLSSVLVLRKSQNFAGEGQGHKLNEARYHWLPIASRLSSLKSQDCLFHDLFSTIGQAINSAQKHTP